MDFPFPIALRRIWCLLIEFPAFLCELGKLTRTVGARARALMCYLLHTALKVFQ
jgi:hypothetical protein